MSVTVASEENNAVVTIYLPAGPGRRFRAPARGRTPPHGRGRCQSRARTGSRSGPPGAARPIPCPSRYADRADRRFTPGGGRGMAGATEERRGRECERQAVRVATPLGDADDLSPRPRASWPGRTWSWPRTRGAPDFCSNAWALSRRVCQPARAQ
jgi:hypothetical protein